MNYKYMQKVHEVAHLIGKGVYNGQPYKLSEHGRILQPAAVVSIEYTARSVKSVLQVKSALSDLEIEKCLWDLGLIK